jgi:hypothetical protein
VLNPSLKSREFELAGITCISTYVKNLSLEIQDTEWSKGQTTFLVLVYSTFMPSNVKPGAESDATT